ncbi:MAG: PDZ domain-containing protein, partial [Verrucomicrobium sp.]
RAQLPLPAGTGLLVRSVVPDSPAAKAGLQKNDVLVRLDDQILVNSSQLRTLVSTRKDGDAVKLALLRQGKEVVSEAKLGTRNGGDDAWDLATVITGGNPQDNAWASTAFVKPFVLQSRALVVDPEGNVVHVPAPTLPAEELTRLQEELKKAGVSGDVSKEVERTLADVRRQLEESKIQLEQNKSKTLKRLEESAEELAGALQRAKEAMERTKAEAQGKMRKMEPLRKGVPAPAAAPVPTVPAVPPVAPSAPVPPIEPGAL